MTAPPRRLEVTNPARHGPEFSSGITFNIRNLPRCVIPLRFTRSYSRRCVRRRVFGKENELISWSTLPRLLSIPKGAATKTRSRFVIQRAVQKKSSHENRGKTYKKRIPVLLRRRRLGRRRLGGRLLGASRRIRVPRGGFRCSRTRCVSRDRRRGRGSWTCRRRDSFSFLLARCEKRA